MKTLLSILLLFILAQPAAAQQIEVSGGGSIADGTIFQSYSLSCKKLYKGFGAYAGFVPKQYTALDGGYKMWKVNRIVREIESYGNTVVDSNVVLYDMVPVCMNIGFTYTLPLGLSFSAGGGISIHRLLKYVNLYDVNQEPRTTRTFTLLTEKEIKPCFEIAADYDLLRRSRWSFGPRLGYNTITKFSAQLMIGYNINENK